MSTKYRIILKALIKELSDAAAFMDKEDWADYAINRIMELKRELK